MKDEEQQKKETYRESCVFAADIYKLILYIREAFAAQYLSLAEDSLKIRRNACCKSHRVFFCYFFVAPLVIKLYITLCTNRTHHWSRNHWYFLILLFRLTVITSFTMFRLVFISLLFPKKSQWAWFFNLFLIRKKINVQHNSNSKNNLTLSGHGYFYKMKKNENILV